MYSQKKVWDSFFFFLKKGLRTNGCIQKCLAKVYSEVLSGFRFKNKCLYTLIRTELLPGSFNKATNN